MRQRAGVTSPLQNDRIVGLNDFPQFSTCAVDHRFRLMTTSLIDSPRSVPSKATLPPEARFEVSPALTASQEHEKPQHHFYGDFLASWWAWLIFNEFLAGVTGGINYWPITCTPAQITCQCIADRIIRNFFSDCSMRIEHQQNRECKTAQFL